MGLGLKLRQAEHDGKRRQRESRGEAAPDGPQKNVMLA